jgi:hypothetical protein
MSNKLIRTTAIISMLLCLCSAQEAKLQVTPARPLKESDLYGDWVGLSDDDLNFYRLRLEKDNKGCLATTFNDDSEVDLYRIKSWGILNGSLTIQLIPMTKEAEDLEITNIRRKVHSLKCTIGSPSGSWSRSAVLYQEKHVSKASSKTKSAMNAWGN